MDSYYPTIENTFSKTVTHAGTNYGLEIVDTAGQVCSPPSPSSHVHISALLDVAMAFCHIAMGHFSAFFPRVALSILAALR